jgi:hypothetical protein
VYMDMEQWLEIRRRVLRNAWLLPGTLET